MPHRWTVCCFCPMWFHLWLLAQRDCTCIWCLWMLQVSACACALLDIWPAVKKCKRERSGLSVNILMFGEAWEACQYPFDVLKEEGAGSLGTHHAVHQQWEESIKTLLGRGFDMVQHSMGQRWVENEWGWVVKTGFPYRCSSACFLKLYFWCEFVQWEKKILKQSAIFSSTATNGNVAPSK